MRDRILARAEGPGLFSLLAAELSPADLQSLLIEVFKNRAEAIGESAILARSGRNSLFAPSTTDARRLAEFDRAAFAAAAGFEAVELSPVCPFGTTRTLGGIAQDHVVTTIRNAELLGDSTPALALECARRRRRAGGGNTPEVMLAASHRVVRLQPVDFPGYTPHFRLFALVTAGRDSGSNSFKIRQLTEHIRCYLRLFRLLNAAGFDFQEPLVEISDAEITKALLAASGATPETVRQSVRAHIPGSGERFLSARGLTLPGAVSDPGAELDGLARRHGFEDRLFVLCRLRERVVEPLSAEFPEACFRFNLARLEGLSYYTGLCFRVSPAAPDGNRYPVTDGGFTDWTARLMQDRKERLLSSGIGSEFACRRFWRGHEG